MLWAATKSIRAATLITGAVIIMVVGYGVLYVTTIEPHQQQQERRR
jgi:hypothetical protein